MSIEEFKSKLQKDFGVDVEVQEISVEAMPIFVLRFSDIHSNVIMQNLQHYTFHDMAISANQAAKMKSYIPPYVGDAKVYEVSNNPYTIQIQALLPVVYFFVQRVLQ